MYILCTDPHTFIWNPVHLYKTVCTCMYQFVPILIPNSAFWYIPVCTDIIQISAAHTSMYHLVPPCTNTVLYKKVQCCTRRYKVEQKWYKQVQGGTRSALNRTNRYILVHTGMYWCWTELFWAVHTGIYQYVLWCIEFFCLSLDMLVCWIRCLTEFCPTRRSVTKSNASTSMFISSRAPASIQGLSSFGGGRRFRGGCRRWRSREPQPHPPWLAPRRAGAVADLSLHHVLLRRPRLMAWERAMVFSRPRTCGARPYPRHSLWCQPSWGSSRRKRWESRWVLCEKRQGTWNQFLENKCLVLKCEGIKQSCRNMSNSWIGQH